MTTCYKLTNQDNKTFGGCKWGEGVTHETSGEGGLCGPGWLHAYSNQLLAVFLNPIHAGILEPRLWECVGEGECLDDRGLKCGFTRLTTVKEISLPEVTTEQRIAFAILCAMEVCGDPEWSTWADNWLRGNDRTETAARAAYWAADADLVAYWAAGAARAAAESACEAASEAASEAARAAARAARAADWAAGEAADWAADVAADLDLISIAKKAMEY